MKFVRDLREQPIAIETQAANDQHYEVGTGVLANFLGPHMKYSSGFYPKTSTSLAEGEEEMLKLYIERAGIEDGMEILDLGYVFWKRNSFKMLKALSLKLWLGKCVSLPSTVISKLPYHCIIQLQNAKAAH
jgi:hypothetical protein